jgi:uncharacterized heparinase superfamily protein
MTDNSPATRYGRRDLEYLRTLNRAQVYAVLGSFDDRDLDEASVVSQALALVDHEPAKSPEVAAATFFQHCCQLAAASVKPAPGLPAETLASAEAALENRFSFYEEQHQLPAEINWDFNPGTAHWGHDLNRFSYLGPLTQAQLATGDGRYGRKAVALILDWIAKCDLGRAFTGTPYVFGSYLNNAIHCQQWCRTVVALLPHGVLSPVQLLRILKSLHEQVSYLEIVTNGHAGNWPTIGCMGILSTISGLPVLRCRERLANYCSASLATQIAEQILPDGAQDELTPHYHQVVINNLCSAAESLRLLGQELPLAIRQTLRRMVHYAQQTIVPDGSARVAFNDSDPQVPGESRHEHLRLALARAHLESLLTPMAELGPELFPYAGVAILRQRPSDGDLYLAFDGGPYGRAHQHEDKLGFWLYAYGRNFIVDPGRHLYDNSAKSFRAYLHSTVAHSTIMVDGLEQHSKSRRETWIAKAPEPIRWQAKAGELRAAARYDLGYGPDNALAVIHQREIVFLAERCWVIFDRVSGAGAHLIESRFHFLPGQLQVTGDRVHTAYEDANLLLVPLASTPYDSVTVVRGGEQPRLGWYSPSYGLLEPSPTVTCSVRTPLPWLGATLLWPYRGRTAGEISLSLQGDLLTLRTPELGECQVRTSLTD